MFGLVKRQLLRTVSKSLKLLSVLSPVMHGVNVLCLLHSSVTWLAVFRVFIFAPIGWRISYEVGTACLWISSAQFQGTTAIDPNRKAVDSSHPHGVTIGITQRAPLSGQSVHFWITVARFRFSTWNVYVGTTYCPSLVFPPVRSWQRTNFVNAQPL